jgi:hypothetical protein
MTPDPDDRKLADDERVAIPLDPEVALSALLAVDPEAEPVDDGGRDDAPKRSRSKP